jgi:hypothetical protein
VAAITAAVCLATAAPGLAQDASQPERPPAEGLSRVSSEALRQWQARGKDPVLDARYKVRIMEGVLEKAVTQAVVVMNQQLSRVSPDLVQLTGAARARGYRLENYGLFFEVEVPAAMRQTMGWTVRMMREIEGLDRAIGSLRRVTTTLEGKERADAELAVRQLELYIRPQAAAVSPALRLPGGSATSASGTASVEAASTGPAQPGAPAPGATPATPSPAPEAVPAPVTPAPAPINPLLLQNPDLAYEIEVREALIGAMLEYGGPLPLGPDEWLTVAARDNQDVIIPGDMAEVVTVIMRIKGNDLAEFKAGRLTAAEVRKRVEVREF